VSATSARAATHREKALRRWAHWYRRVFPAYAIFLFASTHLPRLRGPDIPASDKVMHLLAFGGLTFLFWRFCETFESRLSSSFVWAATPALIAWAAFDEYTQQFVYRGTDWADFIADTMGILLVTAFMEWRRRVRVAATAAMTQA
jgi:VanZ family protein